MSIGQKSFSIEPADIDKATFKDAWKKNYECEEHAFVDGQRLGRWAPTREMLWDHMRFSYEVQDRVAGHIRSMWWCIGIEAVAILALIVLHLC